MPVKVRKRGDKYRIVEGGKLAKSKEGKPVDGGGHRSRRKAERQQRAINSE